MTPRNLFVPPCAAFLLAALLAAPVLAQKAAPAAKLPQSTALLGVAAPRVPAGGVAGFASSSLQGDGTVGNPYIKLQIPGFDKDAPAAISPWRSVRNVPGTSAMCPQEPVQVMTTNRRHVRLSPLYRDVTTGACAQSLACSPGLAIEPVELRQGLIDAGDCAYGSIAFDVRILPNADDLAVCATRSYLKIVVTEHDPITGVVVAGHDFVVDRAMFVALGLGNWQRLTFHFAMQIPGSLLTVGFELMASRCSAFPTFNGPWAYPASVDLDNVALDTIPVVTTGIGGVIVSGCQSGIAGCGSGVLPVWNTGLFGVPSVFAQHDAFATVLCPQSYCNADLNFDGSVGSPDLSLLLSDWGTLPTNICLRRYADLDGDQQVGSSDLAILLGAWGPCP